MISDEVLAEAVAKGLVTPGQALALQSLARQRRPLPDPTAPAEDPEALRFLSGFADVFVTIGLVLFLGSAGYLLDRSLPQAATAAILAMLAWALAEVFSRRWRMALPSIVLLGAFVIAAYRAVLYLFHPVATGSSPAFGWVGTWVSFADRLPLEVASAALATAALVGLHYWRFRVPIAVAAMTGALLLAGLNGLDWLIPGVVGAVQSPFLFAAGAVAFAFAMRFDAADPERRTRRADIAFWLHLLAAPLLVHSVFTAIGAGSGALSTGTALAVLGVFVVIGAVAILVDRRALLVSGLLYAGFAFGTLLAHIGLSDTRVPAAMLAIGALVLALSIGWAPLRRVILAALPEAVTDHLPRPGTGGVGSRPA